MVRFLILYSQPKEFDVDFIKETKNSAAPSFDVSLIIPSKNTEIKQKIRIQTIGYISCIPIGISRYCVIKKVKHTVATADKSDFTKDKNKPFLPSDKTTARLNPIPYIQTDVIK